jgi:hypothetical protein
VSIKQLSPPGFNKDKLELYGHIFGAPGISPDHPKKVAPIKNAPVPKDVGEIRPVSIKQLSPPG